MYYVVCIALYRLYNGSEAADASADDRAGNGNNEKTNNPPWLKKETIHPD